MTVIPEKSPSILEKQPLVEHPNHQEEMKSLRAYQIGFAALGVIALLGIVTCGVLCGAYGMIGPSPSKLIIGALVFILAGSGMALSNAQWKHQICELQDKKQLDSKDQEKGRALYSSIWAHFTSEDLDSKWPDRLHSLMYRSKETEPVVVEP